MAGLFASFARAARDGRKSPDGRFIGKGASAAGATGYGAGSQRTVTPR
jgi:hypothetical protein